MTILNTDNKTDRCFAQGARCGYLEGKGRAGSYVNGEEWGLSWTAADDNIPNSNTPPNSILHGGWASGYREGYRLAAQGEKLPEEFENCPLP